MHVSGNLASASDSTGGSSSGSFSSTISIRSASNVSSSGHAIFHKKNFLIIINNWDRNGEEKIGDVRSMTE